MKTKSFLFLIALLFGLTNCDNNEITYNDSELKFCAYGNVSDVIVNYNEIVGYDSIMHTFRIKESAWDRLNTEISPNTLNPGFGFSVVLDNQIIYTAHYIPPFVSSTRDSIITFLLPEPELVNITLGYPAHLNLFTGEDLRNDQRVLAQLAADNKIIEIEN